MGSHDDGDKDRVSPADPIIPKKKCTGCGGSFAGEAMRVMPAASMIPSCKEDSVGKAPEPGPASGRCDIVLITIFFYWIVPQSVFG